MLVRDGHNDSVYDIAFDSEGGVFATASADRTVRLWEAPTGRLLQIVAHESHPFGLTYLAEARGFFSCTREGVARLTRPESGSVEVMADLPRYNWTISAVSPDGRRFALGCGFDMSEFAVYDPDNRTLSVDGRERVAHTVQVFELATRRLLAELAVDGELEALTFSADGSRLLLVSQPLHPPGVPTHQTARPPTRIEVWDIARARLSWTRAKREAKGRMQTSVRAVPGGGVLVSEWEHSALYSRDGELVRTFDGAKATAVHESGLILLHGEAGAEVVDVQGNLLAKRRGNLGPGAFSADGNRVHATFEDHFSAWDFRRDVLTKMIALDALTEGKRAGHWPERLQATAVSPQGNLIVLGMFSGALTLWNGSTFALEGSIRSDKASVARLAFAPDGRTLAIADTSPNLTLLSLESGRVERRWRLAERPHHIEFSADGTRIQTDFGQAYDLQGAPVAPFLSAGPFAARTSRDWVASADGRFHVLCYKNGVAAAGEGKSWEPANGYALGGHDAAISKQNHFAFGSRSPRVQIIDLATHTTVATLEGHTDSVMAVRYSPDDRLLATGSRDGSVRLWRLPDYRLVAVHHVFADDSR